MVLSIQQKIYIHGSSNIKYISITNSEWVSIASNFIR